MINHNANAGACVVFQVDNVLRRSGFVKQPELNHNEFQTSRVTLSLLWAHGHLKLADILSVDR